MHDAFIHAETIKLNINQHTFNLSVARTPKQQALGLMYQHQLPQSSGMIFITDPARNQVMNMWMKNTYIPLDMLFIDPKLQIACLIENTEPLSLRVITCPFPTVAVIEINGGEAQKFHIVQGMKIQKA